MPRRGRDFEKLVALVERAIHAVQGATVRSPVMLPDRDTGGLREIDVLIEFRHAHLDLRVAVECREWNAKIGTPAIEAFWSKCLTTGIDQGIFVSKSGFTAGALKKAAAYKIRCLTLEDAGAWDWCACQGIELRRPDLLDGHVECRASQPIAEPYRIFRPDGTEFTGDDAARIAAWKLDQTISKDLRGGPYYHCFRFGPQPGYAIGADGIRHDILGMDLHTLFDIKSRFVPLRFLRYSDAATGNLLRASAVVDLDFGDITAQMLFLEQESGEVEISLWPQRDIRVQLIEA